LTLGPSDRQAGFCVGIQNQLDKFPAAVGATTATRKMITIAQFKQATSYKSETLITGQQTCPFDNRFTSPWQVSTPNRQHKHTHKKRKKRKEKKAELMSSHDGYSLLFLLLCVCVFLFHQIAK
jgi:hypothetical protein